MADHHTLAEQFERNRAHLRAVAYRLLGSWSEADDAVQESWLRLTRSGADGVENLGGWLTTVTARICLDMLRSRTSRREDSLSIEPFERVAETDASIDPEEEAILADSVGTALLIVLEMLQPAERLAFVLHDLFAVSFDEIAPIVGRSPTAARQLASRARRRVQGASGSSEADLAQRREVVDAFLAASRSGDFDGLLSLLDPDIVLRSDEASVRMGVEPVLLGSRSVAGMFSGRAQAAQPALIDGAPGLVWAPQGTPRVVFAFTIVAGKVVAISVITDGEHISRLDLEF